MGQTIDYDKLAGQHGGTVVDYDAVAKLVQADAPQNSAHIGPVTADDTAPVTLGDLIENPGLAVRRMVAITKQAVTDPKVMLPVLAGLAVPALGKAADRLPSMPSLPNVRGMVAKAANAIGSVADPDLVGLASPRAAAGIRYAQKVGQVLGKTSEPAPAPIEVAPASASTGATPPAPLAKTAPASPRKPAATQAAPSLPKTATSAQKPVEASAATATEHLPSLDELHLTPAEITQGVKWHEAGVSPETILHRILQSRQLTARTHAETPDQAAAAVKQRNETGHWGDEGFVK